MYPLLELHYLPETLPRRYLPPRTFPLIRPLAVGLILTIQYQSSVWEGFLVNLNAGSGGMPACQVFAASGYVSIILAVPKQEV